MISAVVLNRVGPGSTPRTRLRERTGRDSLDESIGAAGCLESAGTALVSWVYPEDPSTVELVLRRRNKTIHISDPSCSRMGARGIVQCNAVVCGTHMDKSYEAVLAATSPPTSFFHDSLVSWMISTAYFFDFASPEKAKTFSGLPSGIL